jgi:hypothetical protein
MATGGGAAVRSSGGAAVSAVAPRTPEKMPQFTNHASSHWSVTQILEAFTQIAYLKLDFIPGKGVKDPSKKTLLTIANAHVIGGVLTFFEQAASIISSKCPSFRDAKKSIGKDALRSQWETKLTYRIQQRLSWGKGPNLFHRTGDGDFPDLNDANVGFGNASADQKFELAFQCAQVDDILDSHLQLLSEQESQHRNPGSALSEVGSEALVVFSKNPAAHAFGKPLHPAAVPGIVASASTQRRGENPSSSTKRARGESAIDNSLNFGSSVVDLGNKMLMAMAKPTVEESARRTAANAEAMLTVVEKGVSRCIKEFKKPTVNSSLNSRLSRMKCSDLIAAIKSISTAWERDAALHAAIVDIGLSGKNIANMEDSQLRDFFTQDGGVTATKANILIAEIKSWSQMDIIED